jgi:hypothetical protein
VPQGSTYLRARISTAYVSASDCSATGGAPDGEVEDYAIPVQSRDFGDLPDNVVGIAASAGGVPPDYLTTLAENGPRHTISAALKMGTLVDGDLDGISSLSTADDVLDGVDDEAGLESITRISGSPSQSPITANVRVTNTTGANARICLYVDRNANGSFGDASEIGTAVVPTGTVAGLIAVVIPASGVITQPAGTPGIGIRVRLAPDDATGFNGGCETAEADGPLPGTGGNPAIGEVEDYYTGDSSTVPVTLSQVSVANEGSELVVRFSTASEAGVLSYRVLGDVGANNAFSRTELGSVASKHIDSLREQAYEVRSRAIGAAQIWIEENSILGKATLYGPYQIGASIGERNLAPAMNWAAVNAEQSAFRRTQQVLLRQAQAQTGTSGTAAELSLSQSGWVRLSALELAAAGVTGNELQVRLGSRVIPAQILRDGAGQLSSLAFYGEAVQGSLYTQTTRYRIEAGPASALANESAAASSGEPAALSERAFASNALYSFSAPSDPWFAFRAVRNSSGSSTGGSTNFVLSDYLSGGAERIQLQYWGGLNYSGETPDHAVEFRLNGVLIGQDRFDGFAERSLDLAVPAGALRAGQNSLSLTLLNDTGYASDVVNIESYTLRYRRALQAENNRLEAKLLAVSSDTLFANGFDEPGVASVSGSRSSYTVSNLTSPVVILRRRGQVITQLAETDTAVPSVSVSTDAMVGDTLIVSPKDSVALNPAPALLDPVAGATASYLIISHPSFIGGLDSFVAAKRAQGFTVKVVDVEAIYRYYNAGQVDPAAISLAIQRAARAGTTHVLLVGGDSYDYQNNLGISSVSFLPTHYRRTDAIIHFAPADSVFSDVNGDGAPDVALGRWPVRTQAELSAVIAKTLSYQNTHKAVLMNDRSLNGESYGQAALQTTSLLGNSWSKVNVDLDQYGDAASARGAMVNAMGQSANLLTYFGHSAPASWSREGLLTASQVSSGLFNSVDQSFITVQLGCWATYFVEPTSTTVAHQLLLMPKGAAAVLGASSLTSTASDQAFAGVLLPNLGVQGLGISLQSAIQQLGPENSDVRVGATLLGDPSLR